ncbi:MAG: VOC family protein, partial [Acidimicrobiia bacterium]
AKGFYSKLFTWKMEDMQMGPGMTYTMIQPGEGTGGGLMKHPVPGAPSSWLAYVIVDDVKAATEKAKSLGARIMKDVTEVPGMGWFSIFIDPTGAALGLWQNA